MAMYGGVSARQLNVEGDELLKFRKRVDAILRELESSAASKTKIAGQTVARASFGGSFSEADDLFTQYNRVHQLLTNLSQTLNDQVEAMGIAVLGAKNDFQGMDEDVRRRFWEIQTRAEQRYQDQMRDRQERKHQEDERLGHEPTTPPPGGDGKQGEGFE